MSSTLSVKGNALYHLYYKQVDLPPSDLMKFGKSITIKDVKMMPKPRDSFVSLAATPYYCISPCVRCAFLCGADVCYELGDLGLRVVLELADTFSIDVDAYAVMHNHYHLVLYINAECINTWRGLKICEQW